MAGTTHFVVLQKDSGTPPLDALRRAFAGFNDLTEADAIRLSNDSRGILMRHLRRDTAQAFQRDLQSQGIPAVVLDEDELPQLPEGKVLHRVELSDAALLAYDVLGRASAINWEDIHLVTAGNISHFAINQTRQEGRTLTFDPIYGVRSKKIEETVHRVKSDAKLLLDVVLTGRSAMFHIDAAGFPFGYLKDCPDVSVPEKFAWLVREICRRTSGSLRNEGARRLLDGQPVPTVYPNRQLMLDEMIWLLWHHEQRIL